MRGHPISKFKLSDYNKDTYKLGRQLLCKFKELH